MFYNIDKQGIYRSADTEDTLTISLFYNDQESKIYYGLLGTYKNIDNVLWVYLQNKNNLFNIGIIEVGKMFNDNTISEELTNPK